MNRFLQPIYTIRAKSRQLPKSKGVREWGSLLGFAQTTFECFFEKTLLKNGSHSRLQSSLLFLLFFFSIYLSYSSCHFVKVFYSFSQTTPITSSFSSLFQFLSLSFILSLPPLSLTLIFFFSTIFID